MPPNAKYKIPNSKRYEIHLRLHGNRLRLSIRNSLLETLLQRRSKLLTHLALDAVVHGVQDIVHNDARLVGRLRAVLVHARLDEDAVPVILGLLVDGVGAADVALGRVADKVDGLGRVRDAVPRVAPLAHEARGEFERGHLRLAKGVRVEPAPAAGEVVKGDLEHAAEGAHAEADVLVGRGPDDVVVREVKGGTLVKGLAARAEPPALGHGEVEHDLDVARPVAGVGEDEDGVDGDFVKVAGARVGVLLGGELAEGRRGRVVLDDVAGGDDVPEAVALGDLAALFALAANDEHGAVLLGHFSHGGVSADELAGLDVLQQLA